MPYFLAAFAVLAVFSSGDTFCARPGGGNHTIMAAKLALALTAYDFAVSFGLASVLTGSKTLKRFWIPLLFTTLIVGASFGCLPFWIYKGYGSFRFENTWADVSCFFTEGYLLGFLFIAAPLLTLTTFLREFIVLRFQRRRTSLRSDIEPAGTPMS